MNLKNVWNLGIKELRGLKRDPIMLLLIVYAFSLSVWTSANSTPETMSNAAIAIVDEDQSHLSSWLISSFYPPWFVSPKLITSHEMDERMDAGIDTFALHIPPDFERDVLANKAPKLQLSVDATRIGQAFTGAGYIQQIVSSEVNEFAAGYREQTKLPVDLTVRAKYNPSLDVSWFGAISSVIQSITMLTLVLTGAALIREKEHGTVEHLLVMPVSATEIMLSKIWSMGCVVLIGSAFSLTVIVQRLLEVPIQGSIMLFFAGAVLMLFAMTALGIFMATIAGTMPQFALLMMMVLLPLQVLSGAMTPRESMPELIQTIMLAAPNTHFIMLSQGILFRGAGFDVVWPQLLSLFVIGCVLYTLALRRFRIFLR
jgi:ABC-2 type transport system permease protein